MIVECPKCETRYRFSPGRIQSTVPPLKCAKCGYVFLLRGAKKQSAPKRKTRDEEAPRQPLLFDDEKQPPVLDEAKSLGDESYVLGDDPHELGLPRWTGARPAATREAATKAVEPTLASVPELLADEDAPADDLPEDADLSNQPDESDLFDESDPADESDEPELADESDLSDESDQIDGVETSDESDHADEAELSSSPAPLDDELEHVLEVVPPPRAPRRRRAAPAPPPPEPPSVTPWVVFAVLLVCGYGLLTWSLLAQPARADRWIGMLPGFAHFEPTAVLARSVVVSRLEGNYERLGDREPAFVARGEVVSNATVSLHDVQLRGELLDAKGNVVAEKVVYCGATASSAVLNDLDSREVSIIQRIQPPPRFALPPGHTAPFIMVFLDPPAAAAEVVAAVVGAREIER